MFPFLSSAGGNCQDASMLVEVLAVREKLVGACEGTGIEFYNEKKSSLHDNSNLQYLSIYLDDQLHEYALSKTR